LPESSQPPLPPHPLAVDLARMFFAQWRDGRSLSEAALAYRSREYFQNAQPLVRAIRRAISSWELKWTQSNVETLARFIEEDVPEFQQAIDLEIEMLEEIASFNVSDQDTETLKQELDEITAHYQKSIVKPRRLLSENPVAETPFRQKMRATLPALNNIDDIARALEVSTEELNAINPPFGYTRSPYRMMLRTKANGLPRLLEIPSAALRVLQRRVLHRLLDHVPVHGAAYGFVSGRSVATHASLHAGKRTLIRMDLQDFFPSITARRVYAVLSGIGLKPAVANPLTQMLTTAPTAFRLRKVLRHALPHAPSTAAEHFLNWQATYCVAHLSQGAPTSPALANLVAFRLDQRLSGLAKRWQLSYSRYADDLTFSGDINSNQAAKLIRHVRRIAASEGWVINERKTRVMPQSSRQRVTGLVVNERPNISRRDYDDLKAVVHRFSCSSIQDDIERTRLLGKIAWLGQFNTVRAEKLRVQLNQGQRSDIA
jgi:RNA-directed DNA polymerase